MFSTANTSGVAVLVLDSGAFITGAKLDRFGPDVKYVTVPSVITEIRDEKTRHNLASFPFPIEQRSVSPEAMAAVSRFARKTGDLAALSGPDLQIIALTYMFETEQHGQERIRTELPTIQAAKDKAPSQKELIHVAPFAQDTSTLRPLSMDDFLFMDKTKFHEEYRIVMPPSQREVLDAADQIEKAGHGEAVQIENFQDRTSTEEDRSGEYVPTSTQESSALQNLVENDPFWKSVPGSGSTLMDPEGEWITSENIHLQKHNNSQQSNENVSSVAVITTDYAMQNVILQLGLRLLSVNGLSISQIRTSVKRCHGCHAVERDMEKDFCSDCGGHTLVKVTVTVNSKGQTRYRMPWRTIYNTRGTIYPIPKPKGGRKNTDLKLAEDVMSQKKLFEHRKRDMADNFEDAIEFALHKTGTKNQHGGNVFGYGKKNPNVTYHQRAAHNKNKRNHRRR